MVSPPYGAHLVSQLFRVYWLGPAKEMLNTSLSVQAYFKLIFKDKIEKLSTPKTVADFSVFNQTIYKFQVDQKRWNLYTAGDVPLTSNFSNFSMSTASVNQG